MIQVVGLKKMKGNGGGDLFASLTKLGQVSTVVYSVPNLLRTYYVLRNLIQRTSELAHPVATIDPITFELLQPRS